ncbi:hypothetical protein [Symbiopectobacterium purcellii]|uniref:hypothetical protein n=1 Tax=Symbiopectobacterium purcellii TaxID=2871826 RepID=UPI003F8754C8
MKAPEITVKLYIHFNIHLEKVDALTCDMSQMQGWILLGTHDVTIPVPLYSPVDLIDRQIESLKNQQSNVLADSLAKDRDIEKEIQRLLCIKEGANSEHLK